MTKIAASAAREDFAETLNRVAYKGERVQLLRRGKAVAALVPIEDLALIEALENRIDLQAARKALAEAKGRRIPYAKIRRELGLA